VLELELWQAGSFLLHIVEHRRRGRRGTGPAEERS